jgi:hypothetical protein
MDSWFFLSFSAEMLLWNCGSGRDEEPAEKFSACFRSALRLIMKKI